MRKEAGALSAVCAGGRSLGTECGAEAKGAWAWQERKQGPAAPGPLIQATLLGLCPEGNREGLEQGRDPRFLGDSSGSGWRMGRGPRGPLRTPAA